MSKSIHEYTKKELLKLPRVNWNDIDWKKEVKYDSILVFSNGKKHDSGWGIMTIVGIRNGAPVEICSQCSDDISWHIHSPYNVLRTDCVFKNKILHFWGDDCEFVIKFPCSSVDINVDRKIPVTTLT